MKTIIFITLLFSSTYCYNQTWEKINSPTQNHLIRDVSFGSENIGWIIVDKPPDTISNTSDIYKTENGGITWNKQTTSQVLYYKGFTSIHFIDTLHGIISNGGSYNDSVGCIIYTNNGGEKWLYKNFGCYSASAACLVDTNIGYSISQYGNASRSINGIDTWIEITSISSQISGHKFHGFNPDTVYFIGVFNVFLPLKGAFGKTYDGGISWDIQQFSDIPSVTGIYFYNFNKGWIGGKNIIKYTNDAGQNWSTILINYSVTDIAFIDSLRGFATTSEGRILKTIDGGFNWSISYNGSVPLSALCFTKPNNVGYAIGDSGTILKINTLSINKNNFNNYINIFPNPSNGLFTLEFNTTTLLKNEIEIYNINSQKIYSASTNGNTYNIDITDYAKGLYFVIITNENGKKTGKVMVQ